MPNLKDFIPSNDAELLAWGGTFSGGIAGKATALGLTAAQVTAVTGLFTAFSTAQAVAENPATRTRGTISARDDAARTFVASARELARIINNHPGMTNETRINLGLTPRSGTITPRPVPATPPKLAVVGATGRLLGLRITSSEAGRRGKDRNAVSATVMWFAGETPPADITKWVLGGQPTKTTYDLELPSTVAAGAKVWITAFWMGSKGRSGPACQPIAAYVAGGVTAATAELKIAA